ncbi:MAG: VWA domain-containing protein [Candidatus Omnitrophota bacterium]
MMDWGQAKNFSWLWVVPFAAWLFFLAAFRKSRQIRRFGDPALVARLILSFDRWKRTLKRGLVLAALAFIVLALCQPHFRSKEITVERKGIDVIIAVDVSNSMLARDIPPNRLEKAKLELSTLIERLKQDRIGIVAFAGEAFIQCPLTLDRSAVKLFLSTLSPSLIPTPGTALGPAILVSTQAFAEKDKEHKAVILLTDGEDHGSKPMEAVKRAKEAHVRIFTVGIGTPDGSTLPTESAREGFKKDRQGKVILSKLDENLLKDIARETGGVYTRSTRGELEVEKISREIRKMTQKGLRSEKTVEYEENFQYFLLPAFVFLILEMILSERKK